MNQLKQRGFFFAQHFLIYLAQHYIILHYLSAGNKVTNKQEPKRKIFIHPSIRNQSFEIKKKCNIRFITINANYKAQFRFLNNKSITILSLFINVSYHLLFQEFELLLRNCQTMKRDTWYTDTHVSCNDSYYAELYQTVHLSHLEFLFK